MRFSPATLVEKSVAAIRRMSQPQRWMLIGALTVIVVLTGLMFYQNSRNGSMDTSKGDQDVANEFGVGTSYSKAYYVSPAGKDSNDGTTTEKPLASINKAISFAASGDVVYLADGDYYQSVATVKDGSADAPITIQGSRKAVIRGANGQSSRVFEIKHSYIHLEGFAIDGQHGKGERAEDFKDKLLYVIGREPKKGVEGLRVRNMLIQNGGGECIRLRYFARNNEISNSTIKNCGVHDFRFDGGSKNGEAIYIGTAPEQRADGKNPTADPDVSTNNVVSNNFIDSFGNECVDIKESSTENIVESNTCQNQKDANSGGFDARGNNNTFRYNTSRNNVGAGFRLGGDSEQDGAGNNVYENTISGNQAGALKILRQPQGKICGNKLENNANKNKNQFGIDPSKPC